MYEMEGADPASPHRQRIAVAPRAAAGAVHPR